MPDELARVRRVLLHQVARLRVGPRRAPLLEGEDVVPSILLAQLHQRGAGIEPVAEDAHAKVRERRLQHWRKPQEAVVLAVLLLVLVSVVPWLYGDRHDGVGGAPRGYQLRLQDIPVGAVAKPPAAADPLLLRAVHRDGEHAPEPRAVEHLEPHHVRHDVHKRLFEHRGAAARQVVADAERAWGRAPFAFDPPVLPRELVHRVGPALVVAQGVDGVARAHPPEEPQDERPEERPPLVEALRGIPFLAYPVEQGVQYPAEARKESGQLFERLFAVRRFRRPPAGALARMTVFLPVLSVIASTSSARATSLISFRSRFASAHLADQSATSGAKSAGT